MPPPCGGCTHAQQTELDADIALGAGSNQQIGQKYGLSKDAVRRHRAHVSAAVVRVLRDEAGPRKALDDVSELFDRVEKLLTKAEKSNQGAQAVNVAKELRALVELRAKLTGELDESTKVQVINLSTSPDWLAARQAMFEVLRNYPEAARAVSARLQAIEA